MAAVNGINGLIPHRNGTSSDYTVPLLINGNEVTTEATFKVTSPSTNQPIWSSSSASVSDAVAAAEAAQAAFPAWRATKPSFRRDLLLKAADIFSSRALELVGYMNSETGSENSYSAGFNIPSSIEQFKDIAGRIVTVVGTQPECAQEGKYALVMKEPCILPSLHYFISQMLTDSKRRCDIEYCPVECPIHSRAQSHHQRHRWRQHCRAQGIGAFSSLLLGYR